MALNSQKEDDPTTNRFSKMNERVGVVGKRSLKQSYSKNLKDF